MTALIVALVITGASLLIAEAHLASYGLLGATGIAALAAGIVLGVVETGGGLLAGIAVATPVVLVLAVVVTVAGRKTLHAHRRRARGGGESLVGHVGVVRHGNVFVDGELWRARRSILESDEPALAEGDHVVVEQVRGLTVAVRRAEEWELL